MNDSDEIGFDAKRPIGLWNQRLDIDCGGIFKIAAKATLKVLAGDITGGVSGAIDDVFAIKTKPLEPEEQAWLLIRRCLAHAMAKLAVEALKTRQFSDEDVERLVGSLDGKLEGAEIQIGREFFNRPAEHEVLEIVRPTYRDWLDWRHR